MTIIIDVTDQQMAVKGHKVPLAPHSKNFIKLTFLLPPEWKNFKTFAQFRQSNNSPINVYLDESNSVYVPREIKAGNFTVMLYGAGESIIGTTNCLIFDMVDNCFSTDAIETDLTPTLYQQLLNEFKGYFASTKADAESATASENAAKSYATAADASAQSASGSATAAAESASASATSAGESEQSKTQAQEYAQNAYNSAVGAESAKDDAEDARDEIRSMRAEAVTLSPGSDATASYSDGLLSLGIPRGDKGETGATGATGPKGDKGDTGEVSAEQLNTALATKADAIISSASGAIASFQDGAEAPVKSLAVGIEPVQAGSGDPSPDNVRPITGWTGAKVTVNEDVLDIAFPSEAGTVYGGTLDVVTGELVVDRAMVVVTAKDTIGDYYHTEPPTRGWAFTLVSIDPIFKRGGSVISSINTPQDLHYQNTNGFCKVSKSSRPVFKLMDAYTGLDATSSSEEILNVYQQFVTQNECVAVYELATPITYHLTPQEITTLLGQNNIWSDTGDTSVTYKADTKLYIDKKFTELQALILEN